MVIVPKICTPIKIFTYILKLSFSNVHISSKLKQAVKHKNMIDNIFNLKCIWYIASKL